MKSLQWSILACFLAIVAFAIAFTALKTASDLWYSTFYTFTAILLLSAVIAARFRRGNEKAFWFGFAIFGWCFFVLGLGPWPRAGDEEGGLSIALNRNLLTSRVILALVPYLRTSTDNLAAVDKITTNTTGIAHLLITLVIAIGGGTLAVLIRSRRGRLVSVKTLAILAGLAVVTTFALSIKFAPPSFRSSVFKDEPLLRAISQRDHDATIYRLIWLPTYHHPVCVRIHRTSEGARLSAVVFDGKGGYDPGQVAIDKSVRLGADQVKDLDRHMEQAAFWTMPTEEKFDGVVADGDSLILEGVKGGRYHIVRRVLPDKAYTKLCRRMLELTGLEMREAWEGYHSNDEPEM
jgi:hypothetical protein